MFSLASGIYQSYFAPPKLSILIIGLDGSGKTSLLERIKVTKVDTKVDVSSHYHYLDSGSFKNLGKGQAVAGVTITNNERVAAAGQGGSKQDSGKPARLPPPLPPKKAAKSRRWVKSILTSEKHNNDSYGRNEDDDGVDAPTPGTNATRASVQSNEQDDSRANAILRNVPPPPFSFGGEDGVGARYKDLTGETASSHVPPYSSDLPPLVPTKSSSSAVAPKPTTSSSTKGSSFIQLLRCPSPQRYSSSAGDDEEYHESTVESSKSQTNEATEEEEWNVDHLKNYQINYRESEEFDVKRRTNVKMFPLDRIRPTLGQNLATLDLCGCKCSLFDLSGAVSYFVAYVCL